MAKQTILNNIIEKVLEILRSAGATPKQVRYIFKRVREQGKYQTSNTPKVLPDFLNDAEIDYILNKAMLSDKTTSLLIHFAIFTGLRINEITNLKVMDIDFSGLQLKVVAGKGQKDRYVPITTGLAQHIRAYLNGRIRGNLFAKSNETPYTKRALQKKIEHIIKECQFTKKLSSHSLRHTYATLLRRRGMSLDKIQILLGHSNRATTEIYAHIELAPVKDEYQRLIGLGG